MKIEKTPFLYSGSLKKGGVLFNANEILKINIGGNDLNYYYGNKQLTLSRKGLNWTATDNWHIYKIEEKEDEKG